MDSAAFFSSGTETMDVLEDLTRESLRALLLLTVVLAWVWAVPAVFIRSTQAKTPYVYLVLALLVGASVLSNGLEARRLTLAIGVYLLALMAAVTTIALAFHGPTVLYLYVAVLPITATLAGPCLTWGMAAASTGLVLAIGLRDPTVHWQDMIFVTAFVLLTALTLWLSSRRLLTSLAWTLTMTERAQKNEREARERRGEVRSMLKSLEEAYGRLERANEALIFAREAAEKAYRFKAEFVANVSHELRTPLNLIVGFSEMMATAPESYGGTLLPSEYRGDVTAIYRSARHLSDLINDVLDLSQIEAGRLPLTRELADLGEIVREAVEMVRGLAEAKGLRLELDLPASIPALRLDRTRIRQVLLNLLSNASRFTDRGQIRVQASIRKSEVWVKVEDSGRGISPERIAQAFEAFSHLDEDLSKRGAGLGLALSKSFVELHGGTMAIESTLGHGTVVTFSLPLPDGRSDEPLVLVKGAPVPGQQGWPRVLVLHSDPHALTLLRRYIEGYQFVLADTVDRAVSLIREAQPVAAILDSDWSERWAQVSARGVVPRGLPVLTCPLPSLRRFGLLLGGADYLAKPVTRGDLAAALARLPHPPQTVLVVDDDRHLVRLLSRLLTASEPALRVLEASGGREGLDLVRSQRPDLVLLDLLMPEGSGYEFLEEIRRDGALASTPVIIMSARPIEDEVAPIKGDLWLRHPAGFSLGELLRATEALLGAVTQSAIVAPASG